MLNIIFFEEYTQYFIKIKSNIYIDLYDIQWLRYSAVIEELFKINSRLPNLWVSGTRNWQLGHFSYRRGGVELNSFFFFFYRTSSHVIGSISLKTLIFK